MNVFLLFKNIMAHFKDFFYAPIRLTRLQSTHPTCRFYPGASVDKDSSLGRYNVIFANSSVINSVIGDHSFIQKNSRILNADIGKFCSISSRVSIGLGRHSTTSVSSHPAFYSNSQPIARTFCKTDHYVPFKRVTIGHDVWIGENVMVMDGVRIGTGAVIAMGSVVTANVPAYAIVAGNPARVFSSRFDEETRDKLLATKWWERPDDWFQENCTAFSDPYKIIKLFETLK